MGTFEKHCDQLASLMTFDPAAFKDDGDATREVCNFVLALALFYNDFKDIAFAQSLLGDAKPDSTPRPSREWGCYSGILLHIARVQIALVHELLELVRSQAKAVDSDTIAGLVKNLRPRARDAWHTLVAVARGSSPQDSFGRALLMIRNKLSFHYDPKIVRRGYDTHFFSEHKEERRAFVSRGGSMSESRFYFADAAAQDYLQTVVSGENWKELSEELLVVFDTVNQALMGIVDAFVQKRAGAYREHREEVG